jgi:hypothetical protein
VLCTNLCAFSAESRQKPVPARQAAEKLNPEGGGDFTPPHKARKINRAFACCEKRRLLIRPLNSVEVSHPFRKKRGKDGARGQYLWAESIRGKKRQGTTSVVPKKLFNRSRALDPEGYYPVETDDVATTRHLPQGLKAGSFWELFAARLKSCPDASRELRPFSAAYLAPEGRFSGFTFIICPFSAACKVVP